MQPYKRKRRTRRDMITLGGWLFADLLLGLSLLFLVANTVGEGPPPPTPTPMPDYFATAESEIASHQLEAEQTVVALESDLADSESAHLQAQSTADALESELADSESAQLRAQSTADALATQEAMTAAERATADAQATEEAVVAQATIEALSTEQAEREASQEELDTAYATTVAEATNVARELEIRGTEQAELRLAATEDAQRGIEAESTVQALELSEAQAQATSESAIATADAASSEILSAQEQAQLNTLDPTAVPQTIRVDLDGVISGDDDALDDAREELHGVLDQYVETESCRIGFVLISSRAPTISEGIQLSNAIADLIPDEFPELMPLAVDDEQPTLASESIALPNTTPTGEVQLLLFLSAGCEPSASSYDSPLAAYARKTR